MNDDKYLIYSEHVIKSKVFPNEKEAQSWFDEQKKDLTDKGLEVYEPEAPFDDDPAISELADGQWEAFIEAGVEVYEDIEPTKEA